MNVEIDAIASETSKLAEDEEVGPMPMAITPPYLRSKAMLKISATWITSCITPSVQSSAY